MPQTVPVKHQQGPAAAAAAAGDEQQTGQIHVEGSGSLDKSYDLEQLRTDIRSEHTTAENSGLRMCWLVYLVKRHWKTLKAGTTHTHFADWFAGSFVHGSMRPIRDDPHLLARIGRVVQWVYDHVRKKRPAKTTAAVEAGACGGWGLESCLNGCVFLPNECIHACPSHTVQGLCKWPALANTNEGHAPPNPPWTHPCQAALNHAPHRPYFFNPM